MTCSVVEMGIAIRDAGSDLLPHPGGSKNVVFSTQDKTRRGDLPEIRKAIVRQIAATPNPPTAYVAGAHRLVAPLVSAIHDAGLRMPEDVSFLSFGDSDWASAHRPQLSVIRHDYYGEASQIAELEQEASATRKLLERLPASKLAW